MLIGVLGLGAFSRRKLSEAIALSWPRRGNTDQVPRRPERLGRQRVGKGSGPSQTLDLPMNLHAVGLRCARR